MGCESVQYKAWRTLHQVFGKNIWFAQHKAYSYLYSMSFIASLPKAELADSQVGPTLITVSTQAPFDLYATRL